MRYFVTGGTGFIGSTVVSQLRARGDEVVALVRDPGRATALEQAGAELHRGDILDKDSMRSGMRGCDGLFHLAAWYQVGVRDASAAEPINVDGTRNVLELMKELQIPRGIYTSTLAVHGDTGGRLVDESVVPTGPIHSEYERTKRKAHCEVAVPMMEAGLPLTTVLPGMVYGAGDKGPMQEVWEMYLRRRMPMLPKQAAFCWSHVDDTAAGHLLAADHGQPGEQYIIAGPPHTMVEAFELAEKVTGIPAPKLRIGPSILRPAARMTEWVERLVPLPPSFSAEALHYVAGATYIATHEKARQELGFAPRPLEDGFPEYLESEMRRLGLGPRRRAHSSS